jgi:hypothetical protein
MREGTTGHLDEVHKKIATDNGWLGGKGDGWEETPYWLDGAVPLAYLLDDAGMKEKVLKYINWTLDHQRKSGYFGPVTKWERETGKEVTADQCVNGEDWWPKMIMLKVLQQYYLSTKDSRVLPFITKYFRYQLNTLNQCPLNKWTEWAEARGVDNMLIAQWVYSKTKDPAIPKLVALLQKQSFKWADWIGGRDWVINAAAYQDEKDWMRRHGVNVGMGIKDPVVQYQRTGDKKFLEIMKRGFNDIMTLHGLPMGVFSADEDLHGNLPTQGTELCAVTESMFSLEEATAISGDPFYMDALERIAFNALPAQTTDDYNNKQYFQIANQVQISRGVFDFSLPFDRQMNNVLGMKSGYTCCLANMHQGWTKFASHLWFKKGNGLSALAYSPNSITTTVGATGKLVTIDEDTQYPFESDIRFTITTTGAVAFPLELRIPAWAKNATVSINGKLYNTYNRGQIISINRTWKSGDMVTLSLPMELKATEWGRNSRAVERGPLVYALKVKEKWEKGTEERQGEYFSVFPDSDWNYGLLDSTLNNMNQHFEVKKISEVGTDFVWNLQHAPIEITAKGKQIPDWTVVNGVAVQPVTDRTGIYKGKVDKEVQRITLVPYGCTKVRIVAFPVVP